MNETLFYIADSISEIYGMDIEEAKSVVINSSLPELLKEIPEFIQHYDADYWAKEIMESISV